MFMNFLRSTPTPTPTQHAVSTLDLDPPPPVTFIHSFDVRASEIEEFGYADFKDKINYKKFVHAWYNFLALVEIDYESSYMCDARSPATDLVVCDATSLGFQRKFLVTKRLRTPKNVIPWIKIYFLICFSVELKT